MAGFDFELLYAADRKPLLLVCLKAAQARARKLEVSWRNEWLKEGRVRSAINGNSRRLDLLAHALERDLPLVAEGAEHAGMTSARRKALGLGFADLYTRGRDTRSDGPWPWRGATETRYYFAPYELTHLAAPESLRARLAVTEGVVIDWCFARVPPVVLLEELHTASELLLEYLVNPRAKRLSFAELVEAADLAGLLSWPELRVSVPGFEPVDGKSLLIALKDYRKNARHRGDMSFEPWLRSSWEQVLLVVERLAEAEPVSPARART